MTPDDVVELLKAPPKLESDRELLVLLRDYRDAGPLQLGDFGRSPSQRCKQLDWANFRSFGVLLN
jgi:hypothetical protein